MFLSYDGNLGIFNDRFTPKFAAKCCGEKFGKSANIAKS